MSRRLKIPVTIITGFLGSGKTTFINNLLMQNQNVKIVVVENEFGDISIDSRLIADYSPASILELNNGCICCSLFNEFSLSLQELVKQSDSFEQLIIETTGVADPESIIQPFFQDADLVRLFEFRGTICLVDALNFQEEIGQFEQLKQIILSDFILLNKVSEAAPEKVAYLRKKVSALNSAVPLIETNYAQIDLLQLNILHAQIHDDFVKKLQKPFFCEPGQNKFYSFTIRFSVSFNEDRFREWFTYFVSFYRKKIFRIKGILLFENSPVYTVLQAVGGAFNLVEGPMINPLEVPESVLVFIGIDISKFEVEKMFDEFLFPES